MKRKLVYCFHRESIFPDEINLKTVSEPFLFSRGTHEISVPKENLSTNTLFILHIYKQPIEYLSKREMPKKIHACPSINKSTERHPHVP